MTVQLGAKPLLQHFRLLVAPYLLIKNKRPPLRPSAGPPLVHTEPWFILLVNYYTHAVPSRSVDDTPQQKVLDVCLRASPVRWWRVRAALASHKQEPTRSVSSKSPPAECWGFCGRRGSRGVKSEGNAAAQIFAILTLTQWKRLGRSRRFICLLFPHQLIEAAGVI